MQETSALYKQLKKEKANNEVKAVIAGTGYYQDRIISGNVPGAVFNGNAISVGGTTSREIDLVIRNPGVIPRMAEINIKARLNNGTQASEWLPKGTFFISERHYDKESDVLTIHAYDAMLKTEQDFTREGDQGTWPRVDIDIVNEICDRIGVKLDERTRAILTSRYAVPYPGIVVDDTPQYSHDGAYSMRECLGYIGAMYAGNWIINDYGYLQLLVLGDIPPETNLLITEDAEYIKLGSDRILIVTGLEEPHRLVTENGDALLIGGVRLLV